MRIIRDNIFLLTINSQITIYTSYLLIRPVCGSMLLPTNSNYLCILTTHKICSQQYVPIVSIYYVQELIVYVTYYLSYRVDRVGETLSSQTTHETGHGSMVHLQLVFYPFSLIAHKTGHDSVVRTLSIYDLCLFLCLHSLYYICGISFHFQAELEDDEMDIQYMNLRYLR